MGIIFCMTHFIHLHCHSEYSLADGLLRPDELARALSMPAIALTDICNLFGVVKFYQALQNAHKKLIIGADLLVQHPAGFKFTITALCIDQQGYVNLIELISKAYLEGQTLGKPHVHLAWLEHYNAGLIVLSGALAGDVGQGLLAGTADVSFWKTHFPNRYYLELQRVGKPREEFYIQAALALAEREQLPVVATNDVRFLSPEDFEAHEARVCIREGWILNDPKRARPYTRAQYLRSEADMCALFSDIPQALKNSVEIAKRCTVNLNLGQSFLPDFPVPAGETMESYLASESLKGLNLRVPHHTEIYKERLAHELQVINGMGFSGYFLIVADFIGWAKNNKIPVGPGRGSGAGSLVAYVLNITDLDPITHELLFERFLNPERVSMPDFDVDFCMDNRDRVIDYVADKFGRQCVSQIITFGTMAARAVVRDTGRVLGHGYGFVDKIAKLIPFEVGMTLDKALLQEPLLKERYDNDEEVTVLIDMALKLEGVARNAGKHAGGVVIAPGKLTNFAPLYCEEGGKNLVTQFDKDDVETVGLVKFDFLGLRTLTIIDWAIKRIAHPIDINTIPMDDKKTFTLLKNCQTTAVFQLESRGMKDLVKRLQPDCFEDIVALVALFRPGPLQSGMVDDFIDRKHGRSEIKYPHPTLAAILKPTYGVILYQEQVMQIAQVLAGYTLGSADILRRAMGKKKPEEMAQQRAGFVAGAQKNGVEEERATYIFDLVEKFAGYGFNKSHSAAYALLAYQTAYLKAHYPAAFMAAVLSSDMDNTDKLINFVEEVLAMKLRLLAPDINQSEIDFTVSDDESILFGLGAVKGAGAAALDGVLLERRTRGPFKHLFDFCERVDLRKVNKRVLEALVKSGAMDSLGAHRASLLASLEAAVNAAEQFSTNQKSGQGDLFSVRPHVEFVAVEEWSEAQRLNFEKESLGLYFSGHPLNRYSEELAHITTATIATLKPAHKQTVVIAGLVMAVRHMQTKRGDRMAFVSVTDNTARIDVAVFPEVYQKYSALFVKDALLVIEGEVSVDEYAGGYKMACTQCFDFIKARELYATSLVVSIMQEHMEQGALELLEQVLKPFCGGACPVDVYYYKHDAKAVLRLGPAWRVSPTDELLEQLKKHFKHAQFLYPSRV